MRGLSDLGIDRMNATSKRSQHLTRSQAFVMHIWREDIGCPIPEWRGRVRHLACGDMRYFRDWRTLVLFLKQHSACPSAAFVES